LLVSNSVADDSLDHERLLRRIFSQLPPEFNHVDSQLEWAVGRGYLIKGARATIWGRNAAARRYFQAAGEAGAAPDDRFLHRVVHQLTYYEAEFGVESTELILNNLSQHLSVLGARRGVRRLKASLSANRAFQSFRQGRYDKVLKEAVEAIENNPQHALNRGVLSILARSMLRRFFFPQSEDRVR